MGVDSAASARALGDAVRGATRRLQVAIEIDSGERRTGVDAAGAARVAEVALSSGLEIVGVFTHGGHGYASPEARARAAADEVRVLGQSVDALQASGVEVRMVSAGSTPTALLSATGPVNEERPGTFVFGDRQQLVLGSCGRDEVGLMVASTVVSTSVPGRVVIDAGSKTLARDRPDWLDGHGSIPQLPRSTLVRTYDYHGVVELADGDRRPDVGEVLSVIPNHVCPVVNLADELVVARAGRLVDRWPVDARGRTA